MCEMYDVYMKCTIVVVEMFEVFPAKDIGWQRTVCLSELYNIMDAGF